MRCELLDEVCDVVDAIDAVRIRLGWRLDRLTDLLVKAIMLRSFLQIELELRRYDRMPPLLRIPCEDAFQYLSRRGLDDATVHVKAIHEYCCGWLERPWHGP